MTTTIQNNKLELKVWVRVCAEVQCTNSEDFSRGVNVSLEPALKIAIYPNEGRALAAQKLSGGIILETNASCLRGLNLNSFGVLLWNTCKKTHRDEVSPTQAFVEADPFGFPHKYVKAKKAYGERLEFEIDGNEWITGLRTAIGSEFTR